MVSVPSPSGDLRQGTRNRFVGIGTGPRNATPVFSAIILICIHTSSSFVDSVLVNEIRAFCAGIFGCPHLLK
jgi:hypothetical protein